MLQFKEPKKYLDGTTRFESTNACNGTVNIYQYADEKIDCVIEYFGTNPKDVGGTNTFKAKKFDDFETAKNWAETQICQEVTITKIEANKLKLLGIN